MTYETPQALRTALEHRLLNHSQEAGIGLDRLRRRVLFERILARLETAEPGRWVLKGGMALEVRVRDAARLTKDIDLGLRDDVSTVTELHERLSDALTVDPVGDDFVLTVAPLVSLGSEEGAPLTWRVKVDAELAGKHFGRIQLDVSPRPYELQSTDRIQLPNSLDFAGIPATTIEVVEIHRHAAEKFHAMLRDFGDRDNSRVRDLVDLVILVELDMLDPATVAARTKEVWTERDGIDPPLELPSLPDSWPTRYERLAADLDLESSTFPAAEALIQQLWADMFPTKES